MATQYDNSASAWPREFDCNRASSRLIFRILSSSLPREHPARGPYVPSPASLPGAAAVDCSLSLASHRLAGLRLAEASGLGWKSYDKDEPEANVVMLPKDEIKWALWTRSVSSRSGGLSTRRRGLTLAGLMVPSSGGLLGTLVELPKLDGPRSSRDDRPDPGGRRLDLGSHSARSSLGPPLTAMLVSRHLPTGLRATSRSASARRRRRSASSSRTFTATYVQPHAVDPSLTGQTWVSLPLPSEC
jgi:hypothetical protein